MKASDGYYGASQLYSRCFLKPVQAAEDVSARCPSEVKTFGDARETYLAALNDVLVFGSDDAVRAARELESTLPKRMGWVPGGALVSGPVVDSQKYVETYDKFTAVMCHEALPSPRTTC